jgi:hypothetical protein
MKRKMLPLRREIAVSELPRGGIEIEIEANARERADIARRFDLLGVEALAGIYHVDPIARGVRVTGEVVARIRQTCVVSLDAFESALREPVLLTFGTDADAGRIGAGQVEISPEEEDPPEPLLDGKIDLGAVTLEYLALGLDPYPRKPGAKFEHENSEAERPASPFAALAQYPERSSPKK